MEFNQTVRNALNAELINQYDFLLNESLQYLNQNQNSFARIVFEEISQKKVPFSLDFESCLNFILDSKEDAESIELLHKVGIGMKWEDNDILFPFTLNFPDLPNWGSEEYLEYRNWCNDLVYKCDDEFWSEKGSNEEFEKFRELNLFNDIVVSSNELHKYGRRQKFSFSEDTWCNYILDIVQLNFPDYSLNIEFSGKRINRFLKKIGDDLWFGFEYDQSELKKSCKRGELDLPYLNIVLLNSSFNKNENERKYYYKSHPYIISLGILGNPFFYYPTYPLLGYSAVEMGKKSDEGKPYLKDIVELGNDKYKIIHPHEYGLNMKKHTYVYMKLLGSTTKIYLDYLLSVVSKVF